MKHLRTFNFFKILPVCALLLFSACNETGPGTASNSPDEKPSTTSQNSATQIGAGGEAGNKTPPPDGGGDRGIVPQRPAELVLSPSTYDFGIQSINSSTHLLITVNNTGEQTATRIVPTGSFGSFGFRQSAYPGFRGTCGSELMGGASCILWVTFSPTGIGTYSTSGTGLSYESGVGVRLGAFSLTGRAMNIATLRFSNLINDDSFWDFGTVVNGTSVTKSIHIYYFGSKTASGVTFSGLNQPFSIQSSTCGTDIAADCDLVIRFQPSLAVTVANTLKLTYNNSSFVAEDTFGIRGTGTTVTTPAALTIQDGGSNQWTYGILGNTYDRTFLVTKSGSLSASSVAPLAFTNSVFSFKGGAFPGTGGTCSDSIATTCTLIVTFSPVTTGTFNDNLRLQYNDGSILQTATLAISASGRNRAVLTLAPTAHDYGSTPLRYPLYKTFTLQNTVASSNASAITLSGLTTGFALSSKTCSTTLAGSSSCTITLRFLPTAVFSYSSPFLVTYFDGETTNTDVSLSLTGAGVADAFLVPSTNTLAFGNIPISTTSTRSFTLTYYGSNAASVTSQSVTGLGFAYEGGAYPGTGGTCSASITSNCTIRIQFSPTALQAYTGVFSLTYENGAGTSRTVTVNLTGTGVSSNPAVLTTSGPSFEFAKTAALLTNSLTVTVSRTGSFSATSLSVTGMSAPFRFRGGSYPGTGGNCSTTLAGSSCTLVFEFAPTGASVYDQLLSLNYFDGYSTQVLSFSLRGESYLRAVLAMTGIFNVGKLPISNHTTTDLIVTNSGLGMATSLSPSVSAPFQIMQSSCGSSLAASTSCTLRVDFSSDTPGLFSRALAISYFEGNTTTFLSNALSGTATVPVLLSVNGNHTCVRTETGSARCWGHNNYGQLGYENTANRLDSAPGPLPDLALGSGRWVKQIATGYWHTCAILDDHSVRCWGSNQYGQLGIGRSDLKWGDRAGTMGASLPLVDLGTADRPMTLSLGYAHSCALFDTGKIKCWGQNSEGQLGLEDTIQRGTSTSEMGANLPFVYLGGRNVSQVASGESHTCALLDNQSVKCWGNNFYGQLGLGDFANRGDAASSMGNHLGTVSLGAGENATALSVGGAFSCALLANGKVKCWGRNDTGILGNTYCTDSGGATGSCTDPGFSTTLRGLGIAPDQLGDALPYIDLGTGLLAAQIASSNSSSCVLLTSGDVKCWGANGSGQLGLGDTTSRGLTSSQMGNSLVNVSLSIGSGFQNLRLGGLHSCALSNDERVKCWGDNRYGSLGYGDNNDRGDISGEMGSNLNYVGY